MRRFAWAALFLASAACARPSARSPEILPLQLVPFSPPDYYVRWFESAKACVLALHAIHGDSLFTLDSLPASVYDLNWIGVATEHPDGAYPLVEHRGARWVWGHARRDSVWVSGQRVTWQRHVIHELLHVLVDSPGEWEDETRGHVRHGLPWGFCEYV